MTALEHSFAEALERLAHSGTLGVAVSGGPDSLALLLLAAKTRPGHVRAATVDHGLRPESRDEARHVAEVCAKLGVSHDILPVEVSPAASLQAQARDARYTALGRWAKQREIAAVATGHHADDQAETLLMRLARGSGVGGLGAIRQKTVIGGLRVIRPLLDRRKAELIAFVRAADLAVVQDPSNADPRHDRTKARALLAETSWLEPLRLARSAAALAQAEEALHQWLHLLWGEHAEVSETQIILRQVYLVPSEMRRRLLLKALELFGTQPRGDDLERLISSLREGKGGTLGWAKVTRVQGSWRVDAAPPRG